MLPTIRLPRTRHNLQAAYVILPEFKPYPNREDEPYGTANHF